MKSTVYPGPAAKTRLMELRVYHQVSETAVIEYALERTLAALSNEEIAAHLHAKGTGLRRSQGT